MADVVVSSATVVVAVVVVDVVDVDVVKSRWSSVASVVEPILLLGGRVFVGFLFNGFVVTGEVATVDGVVVLDTSPD